MRKTSFVKKMKSVLRPIYFGLGIFAVTGLAFTVFAYVSGGISWPDAAPTTVTGVVGQLVGFSSTAVNGDQGGYKTANGLCNTAVPGSHTCNATEITRSYAYDAPVLLDAVTKANNGTWPAPDQYFAWVNNGPPGYTATLSNDCSGWKKATSDFYGSIWNIKGQSFVINTCDNTRRFACCM